LSGRGLCDELITRPEESYRLCCVVVCDLETSRIGAPYIYMTLVAEGLIRAPTVLGASRLRVKIRSTFKLNTLYIVHIIILK